MKIYKTKIKDLLVIKQKNNIDRRGSLRETYNKQLLNKRFIFEYCTTSKKNILRGFHFQSKFQQSKYVNVLKGKIFDVCVDCRKNSKTFGKYFSTYLSEKENSSLLIPKGFAHGFCALTNEVIVHYKCSTYRDKNSEIGILWNDKDLKIKWPIKKQILSKKDKSALSFNDFKKKYLK